MSEKGNIKKSEIKPKMPHSMDQNKISSPPPTKVIEVQFRKLEKSLCFPYTLATRRLEIPPVS